MAIALTDQTNPVTRKTSSRSDQAYLEKQYLGAAHLPQRRTAKTATYANQITHQSRDRLSNPPKSQAQAQTIQQLNERLMTIAQQAQQSSPVSPQRRRLIHRLLSILQRSGQLRHPYPPRYLASNFYAEAYAIALQQTFRYIYEKIDQYDPKRGSVLQWANFLLKVKMPDAMRELTQIGKGLDTNKITRLTLDDAFEHRNFRMMEQQTSPPSLYQELMQLLEDDPQGQFSQRSVKNAPSVNFQVLALKRLSGYSWNEISDEVGISISTLASFYQRSLRLFAPMIRQELTGEPPKTS